MTIILSLGPQKEAQLNALAQERGVIADDLVREAIDNIITDARGTPTRKEPTLSLRGLLAKYGPCPIRRGHRSEPGGDACFFSRPRYVMALPWNRARVLTL
jgi:hypothetical protein